jgi:C4-dicarboxylate-binding protein DctP
MPVGHPTTLSTDLFCKEAEKRSNGTLKMTHYPTQQLYNQAGIVEALPKGQVEISTISGTFFLGLVPEAAMSSLPVLYNDMDHFYRHLYDSEHGGGLDAIQHKAFMEKSNMYNLCSLNAHVNNAVVSKKPIKSMSDYKGKKIRTWGKQLDVLLMAWGASGVIMPSSDTYMAIQRGTVDGVFSGVSSAWSRKWYEPAKYVHYIPGLVICIYHLSANLDFWKSLDKMQKTALLEAAELAEIYSIEEGIKIEGKALEELKKLNVDITMVGEEEAAKFKEQALPFVKKYLLEKTVGEELTKINLGMVEATRNGTMTWQEAIRYNKKKEIAELK